MQDYREVIRRSSPAFEERTRCARRQCRVFNARVRRTLGVCAACCARRSFKETTTERYQNKNRYGVPRGRIRAPGETGMPIANRVARPRQRRMWRDATERYEFVVRLLATLFLAMPNDLIRDSQTRLRRDGCHVSRLGRILIKRAPITSRANPVHSAQFSQQRITFVQLISIPQILILLTWMCNRAKMPN